MLFKIHFLCFKIHFEIRQQKIFNTGGIGSVIFFKDNKQHFTFQSIFLFHQNKHLLHLQALMEP